MTRKDYVSLPNCGFVLRKGDAVAVYMTAEVAETLATELHDLGHRGHDQGWLDMSAALFAVTEQDTEEGDDDRK